MLKKVPFIATAALVLSVCTALALPPAQPVPGATPAGLPPGIELLPDAEMTDLVGAGFWNHVCYMARFGTGVVVFGTGRVIRSITIEILGTRIGRSAANCY